MLPCPSRDDLFIGSESQKIEWGKRLLDSVSSWKDVAAVGKAKEIQVGSTDLSTPLAHPTQTLSEAHSPKVMAMRLFIQTMENGERSI